MDMKEASELIAQKIEEIEKLVTECTSIADESGVGFWLAVGGYGMGGYYGPHGSGSGSDDDDEYGWQASRQSC
jgi:hypothetical protein